MKCACLGIRPELARFYEEPGDGQESKGGGGNVVHGCDGIQGQPSSLHRARTGARLSCSGNPSILWKHAYKWHHCKMVLRNMMLPCITASGGLTGTDQASI